MILARVSPQILAVVRVRNINESLGSGAQGRSAQRCDAVLGDDKVDVRAHKAYDRTRGLYGKYRGDTLPIAVGGSDICGGMERDY